MQNALLTSIGSKVALARIAQQSSRERGVTLHATDSGANTPAMHIVDRYHRIDFGNAPDPLLELCKNENIGLIIPTRHSDLPFLARNREAFEAAGITVAISAFETVDLCIDKRKTADFLQREGIPCPQTIDWTAKGSPVRREQFPLIAKPFDGSASQGLRRIDSLAELEAHPPREDEIVQTLAKGEEFTINLYLDRSGSIATAIPHQRLVVADGESVQAITQRHIPLIELSTRIARALPGAWGPINIQAFFDRQSGETRVIEINPRLGGGFPLAHQAGGAFIEWLFQETFEDRSPPNLDNWVEGLRMLRYRDAIFDFPSDRNPSR